MSRPTPPDRRARVRLHSIETGSTKDARFIVDVRVEGLDGRLCEGRGEASDTPDGRARAGAEAALDALTRATDGRLQLEVRGVKLVRAFDAHMVIVSLRGKSSLQAYHLIGSIATADDQLVRGGVLALLDSTNRILEKYATRSEEGAEEE